MLLNGCVSSDDAVKASDPISDKAALGQRSLVKTRGMVREK